MAIRFLVRLPGVAAALAIVPLLALVLRRAVDIPYWDEWEWVDLVYAAHLHTLSFAQLWAPHNEHRILISNAIMLALDAAGGWNVTREQIVSLVVLALTQLMVWLLIRRTVPRGRRGICFLISTFVLLGLAQYENLEWGFQMAWFICDLGLAVAVWALTVPRRGAGALATAIAAATVASLSSSQGLVVWPVGLIAIVLLPRRSVPVAVGWAVVGFCVSAVVRAGAPGGEAGHVGFSHPGLLAEYAVLYLGAPLAVSFGLPFAALAGGLLLAALAVLAFRALRGSLALRVRLAPWLAMAAYPVLCAVLTATGRAGFGVEQALSSRYTSIGALAWVAAIAGFCVAMPWRNPKFATVALATAALALTFASAKQTSYGNYLWRLHAAQLQSARAALAAGDPSGFPLIYPDRPRLEMLLGELAAVRDGLFSGP
ncbi:MAG: hypothetical protein M3169_10940 [Candidatus Eremiobacteraeota bacterium]|nr:hypothetical protein [Candidatus Eremiobacteraeota bacterium]